MALRLKDMVCVVTGASKGLGFAIAEAMLAEGAVVTGIARNNIGNLDFELITADVSNKTDVDGVINDVYSKYGRIDVLVNNAGIAPLGTVDKTDEATWDKVFDINVKGIYLASSAVIPIMEKQKKGSIVNMSSNYGMVGGLNCAAYCASKGAIVILTKAMALDYAKSGIRVNCVCPGTIDTPLLHEQMKFLTREEIEAKTADRIARHPLGRIGIPEEVAPGVIYLASDESSFVTGAILAIDGGYIAR